MKWPFRREDDTSTVPAEIQEYYQTERRERTGVAWLLALGTLIITIGLATLLFFGGRWLYRTVANNDDNSTDTTSQVEQEEDSSETTTPVADAPSTDSTETGTSSTNTNQPSRITGSDEQSTQTPGTTAGRSTTPVTGDNLPNTGPGDTLAIFVAVTVFTAIAHYTITRRTE